MKLLVMVLRETSIAKGRLLLLVASVNVSQLKGLPLWTMARYQAAGDRSILMMKVPPHNVLP